MCRPALAWTAGTEVLPYMAKRKSRGSCLRDMLGALVEELAWKGARADVCGNGVASMCVGMGKEKRDGTSELNKPLTTRILALNIAYADRA